MKTAIKYIDLQVNGYAGIDFNSQSLTEDQLFIACKKLEADNVESILATIITDDFQKMIAKIKNLSHFIENNKFIKSIIKGIHIEGPFLNPLDGYRGAHPKQFIISANIEQSKKILNAGNGMIKLITLAPEIDINFEVTKFFSQNNVIVSAGHTNASLEILNNAIDKGLKLFTHLGNGTPHHLPRHDNIINRVIYLADKIKICFIADGIHIPFFALKNYMQAAGIDNCIIVTDCMAAASSPPGKYSVSHIQVEVGKDKVVRELRKDNLAGSAITMKESENILYKNLRMNKAQITKLLYRNAKKVFNRIL